MKKWGDFGMPETTSEVTATAGEHDEQGKEGVKEFTAITSQEDFDTAIQARIARERAKFADYDDMKSAAGRLAEIENANKSEAEKREEAFNSTAKERDEARRDAALARAALKHGLAEDDLDLISEGPAEGIEARAAKLAARLGATHAGGPKSEALKRVNQSTVGGDERAVARSLFSDN